MRKYIKLIGLMLSFALILLIFCSCGKCKDNKHTFDRKIITEATCKMDGLIKNSCTECGYVEEQAISKIEHDYEEETSTATCTKAGKKTLKCSRCNETYEEDVKALGHKWVAATCQKAKYCSICKTTEGGKSNHTYINSVCSVCGKENTKTITCQGVNFIVPVEVVAYFIDTTTKIIVTNITFEEAYDSYSSFYVYYSAECLSNPNGHSNSFDYSLYDKNGYVVTSDSVIAPDMKAGEKTKNQAFRIDLQHVNGTDLKKGATYKLKITDND